jgi:hypothetical protein
MSKQTFTKADIPTADQVETKLQMENRQLRNALKKCLHVVEKGVEVRMMDQWPALKQILPDAVKDAKAALESEDSWLAIRKIYAVNQGDDDRHAGSPCWFFENRSDAEQCAVGRGWWGGTAPVSEHNALIVDDQAYLLTRVEPVRLNFTPDDEQAKRNAARAKLTEEERKLLGIR